MLIRPEHYKTENPKYEVWQVVIDRKLTFFGGNALKYIARAGRKGSEKEDIQKAITYVQKAIDEKITLCDEEMQYEDAMQLVEDMRIKKELQPAAASIFCDCHKVCIMHLKMYLDATT